MDKAYLRTAKGSPGECGEAGTALALPEMRAHGFV